MVTHVFSFPVAATGLITSLWVNTTSRRGIEQLGVSFGSVFFYSPLQVAGGNSRTLPLIYWPVRSIDDFLCELSRMV